MTVALVWVAVCDECDEYIDGYFDSEWAAKKAEHEHSDEVHS
jgi:hypothetical protein